MPCSAADTRFAGHVVQLVARPTEKVPPGQGVQVVCPSAAAKKPGVQKLQEEDLPGIELEVPVGQSRQLAADVAAAEKENVPAGHSVQFPWPGLV